MRTVALNKAKEDPRGTAARILDAAEAVFGEIGFPGTSTREIARRAGITFGALHYHWGSKVELFEAVLARVGEQLRDTLAHALPRTAPSPGEGIDRLVDAFVDVLVQHRNATRLLQRHGFDAYDPDPSTVFLQFWPHLLETLRRLGIKPPTTPAPLLVLNNAFIACIIDEPGQRAALGGEIRSSPAARERLLVELRRLARSTFRVPDDVPITPRKRRTTR